MSQHDLFLFETDNFPKVMVTWPSVIMKKNKTARGSWSETLAELVVFWWSSTCKHHSQHTILLNRGIRDSIWNCICISSQITHGCYLEHMFCEDSFWSPKWSSWTSLSAFWTTLRSVRHFKHFEIPFEAISIISKCFEALHEAILSILKQLIKQFRKHLKVFWNRCKSRSNQVT